MNTKANLGVVPYRKQQFSLVSGIWLHTAFLIPEASTGMALTVWSLCIDKIISLLSNCRDVQYQQPSINLFFGITNEWHALTPWICLCDFKALKQKCPKSEWDLKGASDTATKSNNIVKCIYSKSDSSTKKNFWNVIYLKPRARS